MYKKGFAETLCAAGLFFSYTPAKAEAVDHASIVLIIMQEDGG